MEEREVVPVSLPRGLIKEIDELVEKGIFSSRSEAEIRCETGGSFRKRSSQSHNRLCIRNDKRKAGKERKCILTWI